MAAGAQIHLTVLLLSGLHHFGQPCTKPFVERVVFSRTGQEMVSLSLPVKISSKVSTVLWTRKNHVVARIRLNNTITVSGNRTNVSTNGTLLLHKVKKYDRGTYRTEGHDATGNCVFREHIRLEVQDPVSRPIVSVTSCRFGRADLTCEVERGDNVSFRWAAQGGSVNTSVGGPALLYVGGGDGQELICVASNGVSAETSDPLKPDCHDWKKYSKLLILLLCVCGVLLAILCTILCVILWITNRAREGPNTDDGHLMQTDVVYAQVRIMKRDGGALDKKV